MLDPASRKARSQWIRGPVLWLAAVATAMLGATMPGCGDDERAEAPLPPGTGVTSSSKASSGDAASGGSGGSGGAGGFGGGGRGGSTSTGGAGANGSGGMGGTASGGAPVGGGGAGDGGSGGIPPGACNDGALNGQETDVDCGGPTCVTCDIGEMCNVDPDCELASQNCVGGLCVAPTCIDQIMNGNETDLDCGGPNCADCGNDKGCDTDDDCQSGVCDPNLLTCSAPSCTDGVKNGGETGLDCGGTCALINKCGLGQNCASSSDCTGNTCEFGKCVCPIGMLIVPIIGEGSYCIDQTEVSYQEYLAFYQANPSTAGQPPQCVNNANYTPPQGWPPAQINLRRPVTAVDWCDAYAYCKQVGKRLCGKIGGGANLPADYANPSLSEWHNACTANGANVFPYGASYAIDLCQGENDGGSANVDDPNTNGVLPADCIGGSSPFLYHMSGNVSEWEDSCDGSGGSDLCNVRGGSFGDTEPTLRCDAPEKAPRDSATLDRGFRCCL